MPVPASYLAGGTALALILGHRKSVDFDWFTPKTFEPDALLRDLSVLGKVEVAETGRGTFHGFIDGIRVTWLWYPNPLLRPLINVEDVAGLKLASLTDIAVMKWAAISQRGARKDFIDLYCICRHGCNLEDLLALLPEKYPAADINYYHMIKSLSYFDDAEREAMPLMTGKIEWPAVKKYFLGIQKELLKIITA
ncbi:MAG: nucleotidyl transferase AbiEii/AbiGii toxin family protein [Pelotomaculum sp.]|nr:nucleotidyl transferase AbiEii/AbiGii toxin family protein [Pelotomaculum sp.]